MRWVTQALCGLTGHSWLFKIDPERLRLVCQDCGKHTSGVEIDPAKVQQLQARKQRAYPRRIERGSSAVRRFGR